MDDGGYKSFRATEGSCGCLTAAFVGAAVLIPLVLVDALGDCAPDTSCKKGFLGQVLFPSVAIAAVAGLLVWLVVRTIRKRRG